MSVQESFEQLWASLHYFLCQQINGYKQVKEECPSFDCRHAREAWEILRRAG